MPPKKGVDLPALLTLRLDARMRKKLEEMAKAEERSIGAMARIVLREGLATRETKTAEPPPAKQSRKSKST
jgi:hypothetical protein